MKNTMTTKGNYVPDKERDRKSLFASIGIAIICLLMALMVNNMDAYQRTNVYYADIEIADYGTITVALNGTAAPETVENFISLAESDFYDGLTFHRIIDGFMMQGGDPNGNGTGGSGKTIVGEFYENGSQNQLSHTRGAISMARSDEFNSASSQFFIVHQDSTDLDGKYAVFGYVSAGIEIVDAICADAEPINDNGLIAAEKQPVITNITIYEK